MPTPVKTSDPARDANDRKSAVRLAPRRVRGAASINLKPWMVFGAICLVGGILAKGQPWAKPEMFKALDLDLAQTIMNLGIILVFLPVLQSFFYVPLNEAMEARSTELENAFTEAEALKEQMTQIRSDYEARLAAAETEAREQIQAQIKETQALRQSLMAEATAKRDEIIKKAEQDAEAERKRVVQELRREVVDLSLRATERLIAKNVDDAANRKLVEEFIASETVVA